MPLEQLVAQCLDEDQCGSIVYKPGAAIDGLASCGRQHWAAGRVVCLSAVHDKQLLLSRPPPPSVACLLAAGAYLPDVDVGTFRGAPDRSLLVAHPTSVLYLRLDEPGGGSTLSAGAIAGIAVGACVAALAAAAALWVALRRRRRAARPADGSKELQGGADGERHQEDASLCGSMKAAQLGESKLGSAAAAMAVADLEGQPSSSSGTSGALRPTLPRGGSGPGTSPFEALSSNPFAATPSQASRQSSMPGAAPSGGAGMRAAAQQQLPPLSGSSASARRSVVPEALPELAAYIEAAREDREGTAATSQGRAPPSAGTSSGGDVGAGRQAPGGGVPPPCNDLRAQLPAELHRWLIDPDDLVWLRRPDGKLQSLGEGAG